MCGGPLLFPGKLGEDDDDNFDDDDDQDDDFEGDDIYYDAVFVCV